MWVVFLVSVLTNLHDFQPVYLGKKIMGSTNVKYKIFDMGSTITLSNCN
jgi:hypothetical protein